MGLHPFQRGSIPRGGFLHGSVQEGDSERRGDGRGNHLRGNRDDLNLETIRRLSSRDRLKESLVEPGVSEDILWGRVAHPPRSVKRIRRPERVEALSEVAHLASHMVPKPRDWRD